MVEYLIQGETLEGMADKIRTLNGVEGALTTAQMDGNLSEANVDVSTEADLIAQISSALEGKAAGGSGGDNIDTCTVTLEHSALPILSYFATAFTELDGITPLVNTQSGGYQNILSNVICGSVITLRTTNPILFGYSVTNGAELVYQLDNLCVFSIPQHPNGDIVITVRDDD